MKKIILGSMVLLALGANTFGQTIIDAEFTTAQGYADGDLAGQQNWVAITNTGANAFNVSNAVDVGYAETGSTTSFDATNGNFVFYNEAMSNEVDDVWSGSMEFVLSTQPFEGDTNAVINYTRIFDLGITADTNTALDAGFQTADDNDAVLVFWLRNACGIGVTFSSFNVADNLLSDLTAGGIGWSPEDIANTNTVHPFETDPIRLTWTIRKIRNSTDEYMATVALSNTVTGVNDPGVEQIVSLPGIHGSNAVYFAMGRDKWAQGQNGENSLVDISISELDVTRENLPPPALVPQNVEATPGSGQVVLTWDAQTEAAGYTIYRKTGWNGSFSAIDTITGNVYTNSGLSNGEGYYYTVTSLYDDSPNPDIESAPSAQVGASPSLKVFDSVLADFSTGGADALSTVVTFTNLNGDVTVTSSDVGSPAIAPEKNGVTDAATGTLKLNFEAFDDRETAFVPATWSGGDQILNARIATDVNKGWGVAGDGQVNGNLQGSESLRFTVDTSDLNLAEGQKVVLKAINFFPDTDDSRNGDVWLRDTNVAVGVSGAGVQLADNVIEYEADDMELRHGDQFALMRGSKDTFFAGFEFDIVGEAANPFGEWMESYGVYGNSDADPLNDLDEDGFANIYEYGVGGNPIDPQQTGTAPRMTGVVQDGGTNYIEYVYVGRYSPSGVVSVHPETATDLVSGDWTNDHYAVVSRTLIDSEFETVTNRVDTIDPVRMIRLKAEEQ